MYLDHLRFYPWKTISNILQYRGLHQCLSGNLPKMQELQESQVLSLGQEDPLEEGIAAHSSILAWRIPGTWEPGGLPSVGSHRVRHDWSDTAAAAATYLEWASQVALVVKNPQATARNIRDAGSIPGSGRSPGWGKGNQLQCCCLENPIDRGSWWAAIHRVTELDMTEVT